MEHETSQQKERVNAWAVAGGLLLALVVGAAGWIAGVGMLFAHGEQTPPAQERALIALVFLAPLMLLTAMWFGLRQRARDFTVGLFLGGCLLILPLGLCGVMTIKP